MTTTLTDRRYGVAEGLAAKAPCRVATVANIALSGLQTIDGVALAEGDRVVVWQQIDAKQNGLYSASSSAWERTADFDGALDIVTGTRVYVNSGDLYATYEFFVTAANPITIGTSAITFAASNAAFSAAMVDALKVGTSTSSVEIGLGVKNFITQPKKDFGAGRKLLATSDSDPANAFIAGTVTAYDPVTGALTLYGQAYGSLYSTHADWTLEVSGAVGAQGIPGIAAGVPDEVHCLDFLAYLSGSDYAPVYQAAIDYAFANSIQRVIALPFPTAWYSPVYLDPPGNLRASVTAPTMFGWSIELIGLGPRSGGPGGGSQITSMQNAAPALWVGPGAHVQVSRLNLLNGVAYYLPHEHPAAYAGIAISGGNAGAQKTEISHCSISGFYAGVTLGQNNGSFAENQTLSTLNIQNCVVGVKGFSSNAVVTTLINCTVAAYTCLDGTFTPGGMTVLGGEFGMGGVGICDRVSMASTSALSKTGASHPFTFTFTTVLGYDSGDPYVTHWWTDLAFNACTVVLPHFGVVPLLLTGFDAGTGTGTFQVEPNWLYSYFFPASETLDVTDFQAELQAATLLYAAARTTIFKGPIKAYGWRTEMDSAFCLVEMVGGTTSWAVLHGGFTNGDILCQNHSDPLLDNYAHFLAQQAFSFVKQVNAGVVGGSIALEGNNFNSAGGGYPPGQLDSPIFDLTPGAQFKSINNNIYNPNIRGAFRQLDPASSFYGRGYLMSDLGEFSSCPWSLRSTATGNPAGNSLTLRQTGSARSKFHGHLPLGEATALAPADVDATRAVADLTHPYSVNQGAAGTLSFQPLASHKLALVSAAGRQLYAAAKRPGYYWSYGATLDVTGNFKGKTPFVNLTGGVNKSWLFPGLEVLINGTRCVITGIWYTLNYMAVQPLNTGGAAGGTGVLPGTAATEYAVTSIGQNSVAMQKFGRQCEFVNSALSELNGGYFYKGDLIYNGAAAPSGSPGWQVTTEGLMGLGSASFTSTHSGTTLSATAVTGTILVGQTVTAAGIPAGTTILEDLTGGGGAGDYRTSWSGTNGIHSTTSQGCGVSELPALGTESYP